MASALRERIAVWLGGQAGINLDTLEARAQGALTNNATYLAIASPSVAQNTAQIKALTRQINVLIRIELLSFSDISDT